MPRKINRLLPFSLFLVAGLVFVAFTFQLLMWAVWGAPTSWNQYVALIGSLGLCAAAFCCFWNVTGAYWIARASLVGIGCLIVPGVTSLVPSHNSITTLAPFLVVTGYFGVLGFAFLTPRLERWAVCGFAVVVSGSVALYTCTYLDRARIGEYAWPTFDFYMIEGSGRLSVGRDHMRVLTESDIELLSSAGLQGELNWYGRSGEGDGVPVIVICRDRVTEPKQIPFPKAGRTFFIFDGEQWTTLPATFESYERFVILQRDGMLSQALLSGGVQSSRVFMTW